MNFTTEQLINILQFTIDENKEKIKYSKGMKLTQIQKQHIKSYKLEIKENQRKIQQLKKKEQKEFLYNDYKYWKDNIKLFINDYHIGLKEGFYNKTLDSYLEFIYDNMGSQYMEFYEKLYNQMKEYKKKYYIRIKKI